MKLFLGGKDMVLWILEKRKEEEVSSPIESSLWDGLAHDWDSVNRDVSLSWFAEKQEEE